MPITATTKVKNATVFQFDGKLASVSDLIAFVNDQGFDFNSINTTASGNLQTGSSVGTSKTWMVSGSIYKIPAASNVQIDYLNFSWSAGYITSIEGSKFLGFYTSQEELEKDFDLPKSSSATETQSA